jgi:hypothetical protein
VDEADACHHFAQYLAGHGTLPLLNFLIAMNKLSGLPSAGRLASSSTAAESRSSSYNHDFHWGGLQIA